MLDFITAPSRAGLSKKIIKTIYLVTASRVVPAICNALSLFPSETHNLSASCESEKTTSREAGRKSRDRVVEDKVTAERADHIRF